MSTQRVTDERAHLASFDARGVCLPHGIHKCDRCHEVFADMRQDAELDAAYDEDSDWGEAA